MRVAQETLTEWCQRFAHSAFRMETQASYAIPRESPILQKFIAGESKPDGFNSGWTEMVKSNINAGKTMRRLKLLREPFSDYTRSLLDWVIPDNVAAGEDYQILDVSGRTSPVPDQDFWLFDESTVILLNFNDDGSLRDRELVESPDIARYLRWRDTALAEAVPFGDYRT